MTADTPTLTAEERAARLIDMWRQDGVMQAGMEERDMLAKAIKEAEARGAERERAGRPQPGVCGECLYWQQVDGSGRWRASTQPVGDCRRHAPGIFDQVGTAWPRTLATDSCGDWEPRSRTEGETPTEKLLREHDEGYQRFKAARLQEGADRLAAKRTEGEAS